MSDFARQSPQNVGYCVVDKPRQSEVDCGGQLERLTPMKIEACASTHQKYDHVVADAPARAFRLDPDGTVKFTVQSLPITLTRDAEYDLDISIDPGELDALYRFSMTTPKPPKQTAIRRPI